MVTESNTAACPASIKFNGEDLPRDAFVSTAHRVSDARMNGWNVCYHSNSDRVTAWRSEGGATIEAEGYVESDQFHVARMRVVTGAVDAFGNRTRTPGSWLCWVEGEFITRPA